MSLPPQRIGPRQRGEAGAAPLPEGAALVGQNGAAAAAMAALCAAVEARAAVAEKLADAIAARDVVQVQALARALEAASTALFRASAQIKDMSATVPNFGAELRTALAPRTARLAAAEERVRRRLEAAGASSLGAWLAAVAAATTALRDEILREPWDRRRDLVVLGLPPTDPVIAELRAAGQKRIFCLGERTGVIETGERISVRSFASPPELEAAIAELPWPAPTQARVAGCFGSETAAITTRVQEAISRAAQMESAFATLGRAFLSASTRNLARVPALATVASLRGIAEGLPAIIVSAGPSLDLNVAELAAWKGRAVIIAINRAVRVLRAVGVNPDIVLAIDPLNLREQFAETRPGEITALGLGVSVAPELFDVPADRTFTLAASPAIESWVFDLLDESAGLPGGGTVAHTALQLALAMGCRTITVIGQDFALSGEKFYADMAAGGPNRLPAVKAGETVRLETLPGRAELRDRITDLYPGTVAPMTEVTFVRVPGFWGREVLTTHYMQSHLIAYRQMIAAAAGRARFVNATEGGAFIEGMEHRRLAEMTAELRGPIDIETRLLSALAPRRVSGRQRKMQAGLRALDARITAAASFAAKFRAEVEAGQVDPDILSAFRAHAAALPFLRFWAMGSARGMEDCSPDWAQSLAAEEIAAVFTPAIAAALAELGGDRRADDDEVGGDAHRAAIVSNG